MKNNLNKIIFLSIATIFMAATNTFCMDQQLTDVLANNEECNNNQLPNLLELVQKHFRERPEFVNFDGQAPTSFLKSGVSLDDFNNKLEKFNNYAAKTLGDSAGQPHVQKKYKPSGSRVCFMGDIHGSLHSLLRNLLRLYSLGYIDENFKIIKPNFYMVFLGDYVDRGKYSVEVLDILISLTLANLDKLDKIALIRGNHEDTFMMFHALGFSGELDIKFALNGLDKYAKLVENILKFFSNLPLAVFIGSGNDNSWIQCCHGGIEPTFNPKVFLNNEKSSSYLNIADIVNSNKPFEHSCIDEHCITEFRRGLDLNTTPECGFNSCDFYEHDKPLFVLDPNRGYICTIPAVQILLEKCNIRAIFRGHQHREFGLKINGENDWRRYIPEITNTFKIYKFSVFTFSTAAEGVALPYDCFGILQTAGKYEDWTLTPYEYELPEAHEINAKYVHVKNFAKGEMPIFEWHEEPQTAW